MLYSIPRSVPLLSMNKLDVGRKNMKKHWIEFNQTWVHSPMTYWVYHAEDESKWHEAKEFMPPSPPPFKDRGYPKFFVTIDGVDFASLIELRHCIDTLTKKVLPTTHQIIRERGLKGMTNHVWLGRLPKKTHSLKYRDKAIPYLKKSLVHFENEVPNQADLSTTSSGAALRDSL